MATNLLRTSTVSKDSSNLICSLESGRDREPSRFGQSCVFFGGNIINKGDLASETDFVCEHQPGPLTTGASGP